MTTREPIRAAVYVRVSTADQQPETQLRELREYAQRRGRSRYGLLTDAGSKRSRAAQTAARQIVMLRANLCAHRN
jgi:DNA invertase Pin-like site-specific DNA recombinase